MRHNKRKFSWFPPADREDKNKKIHSRFHFLLSLFPLPSVKKADRINPIERSIVSLPFSLSTLIIPWCPFLNFLPFPNKCNDFKPLNLGKSSFIFKQKKKGKAKGKQQPSSFWRQCRLNFISWHYCNNSNLEKNPYR